MDWIYLASPVQGNEADTVSFALQEHVISRPARNSKGSLIPNAGHIKPDDRIVLAYRRRGQPPAARVVAIVGTPTMAVGGTYAIDQVCDSLLVDELRAAGFALSRDSQGTEIAHVIHLVDVAECEVELSADYPGQTTLRRLDEQDHHCLNGGLAVAPPQPSPSPTPPPLSPGLPEPRQPEPISVPLTVDLEWRDSRLPLFDAYIMVDWSGSSSPSSGANSIWLARGGWNGTSLAIRTANPRTREAALETLVAWCDDLQGKRVLLGLDFAFGYPKGFSKAAGLAESDRGPWHAVHTFLGEHVTDQVDNKNNMYSVAESVNECIAGGGPGPFWGCPPSLATADLTTRRIGHFAFPYGGLSEWRLADQRARQSTTTQSVWKLNSGVSVGGQSILGIHRLHQLRQMLSRRAAIWPFETGWAVPSSADAVVMAEIFPSVIPILNAAGGGVKDEQQVRSCVWHAAINDLNATLGRTFAQPRGLGDEELAVAASEEGWILFV